MSKHAKYTAIGFAVSKFVLPIAKKQAKKAARNKAKGAVVGTRNSIRRSPVKASIAVGAVVGALGWLVTRGSTSDENSSTDA